MKRHLNLMSSSACVRECIRTRIRQWVRALVAVAVLLVPTWFLFWWPVHQEGQHVANLNAKFEPFRQMNRATKGFQRNIERVGAQEKTALALAKIDTPVVTLLGVLAKAVADNQGDVTLEDLEFHQPASVLSERKTEELTSIEIEGRGIDENSVRRFASDLRAALPFTDVQILSSKTERIDKQKTQKFSLQFSF